MPLLAVLGLANLLVASAVLYAVRHVVRRARVQMAVGGPNDTAMVGGKQALRYVITHGDEALYDGYDSDAACRAWQEIEHAPSDFPHACDFRESGRVRARRPAKGRS